MMTKPIIYKKTESIAIYTHQNQLCRPLNVVDPQFVVFVVLKFEKIYGMIFIAKEFGESIVFY